VEQWNLNDRWSREETQTEVKQNEQAPHHQNPYTIFETAVSPLPRETLIMFPVAAQKADPGPSIKRQNSNLIIKDQEVETRLK
jgi:hypothetical protein